MVPEFQTWTAHWNHLGTVSRHLGTQKATGRYILSLVILMCSKVGEPLINGRTSNIIVAHEPPGIGLGLGLRICIFYKLPADMTVLVCRPYFREFWVPKR